MAGQRAYKHRPASESRSKAIAAIQICWKQMRPDIYEVDASRDERLEWIGKFLGIKDLRSVTDLTDSQLGAVAGEMKRLTGARSEGRGTSVRTGSSSDRVSAPSENVIPFGANIHRASHNDENWSVSTGPRATLAADPYAEDRTTIHLASTEQVYTLRKLEEYLDWKPADVFEFIRKRVLRGKAKFSGSVPNFQMLTFRQATTATNALLHVAAHRDLKIGRGKAPVSRAEVNEYIPRLKAKLGIDQGRR